MGLIKALVSSAASTMADQWKEYFYCESLPDEVLMKKGQKRTDKGSSNTKGRDNIITNGSVIAVNEGQCMIIVDQGKVAEICAEPGEFTYNSSTEPSLFTGSLGQSIKQTFATMGKRFTFGGDTGKDQRVYYFNIKEIKEKLFGAPQPIPFRVVDSKINLDIDTSVRVSGKYSYHITNPILFYTNVCANVADEYKASDVEGMMKSELIDALTPSFAEISNLEIRPNQISAHKDEMVQILNNQLSEKWAQLRGIEIVSVAFNPMTLPEEDQQLIKEAQKTGMLQSQTMAAATLVGAQADAMKAAASNQGGAMMGFMGMNMAQNAGGFNPQALYAAGQQQQQQQMMQQQQMQQQQMQQQAAPQAPAGDSWTCECGTVNTAKFCSECGKAKPIPAPVSADGWTCECGSVNKGKFCQNCGKPKPAGAPLYKCDKCGWEPEDPKNPPKFCPQCGDPFDDNDIQ